MSPHADPFEIHAHVVAALTLMHDHDQRGTDPASELVDQMWDLSKRDTILTAVSAIACCIHLLEQVYTDDGTGDVDRDGIVDWIRRYGMNVARRDAG